MPPMLFVVAHYKERRRVIFLGDTKRKNNNNKTDRYNRNKNAFSIYNNKRVVRLYTWTRMFCARIIIGRARRASSL